MPPQPPQPAATTEGPLSRSYEEVHVEGDLLLLGLKRSGSDLFGTFKQQRRIVGLHSVEFAGRTWRLVSGAEHIGETPQTGHYVAMFRQPSVTRAPRRPRRGLDKRQPRTSTGGISPNISSPCCVSAALRTCACRWWTLHRAEPRGWRWEMTSAARAHAPTLLLTPPATLRSCCGHAGPALTAALEWIAAAAPFLLLCMYLLQPFLQVLFLWIRIHALKRLPSFWLLSII